MSFYSFVMIFSETERKNCRLSGSEKILANKQKVCEVWPAKVGLKCSRGGIFRPC